MSLNSAFSFTSFLLFLIPASSTKSTSLIQRIRDWPTGQSRRLFWQIFFSHSIPADTKTVAPLNDCLRELVQIFPAKVGITEITIKIGYGEHHPVAVLQPVSQIVGDQSGQDIGRQFLWANQLKTFHQLRWQLYIHTTQGA